VPLPSGHVGERLDHLRAFCNTDTLSAVTQAALAHAQFETIHLFVDRNGRIGRVLIRLVVRRRGPATRVLSPISLLLATWAKDSAAGLMVTRDRATSGAAVDGLNRSVGLFAAAT